MKTCLKLLTAMVAQGDIAAKEVLSMFDFSSKQVLLLLNRRNLRVSKIIFLPVKYLHSRSAVPNLGAADMMPQGGLRVMSEISYNVSKKLDLLLYR